MDKEIEPEELLWAWLKEGWRYRLSQGHTILKTEKKRCVSQVKHEMELISEKGYQSYFLLVSDLIRYAKDAGIAVGPGRGSSAASLVCWLLRITEVNPMLYPLTDFSRFVDITRTDLPDVDIDFDDSRRHEVREYAVAKYGADCVGNVGTFTKYVGKNAINDVARVFSIPKFEADTLGGMVIERSGGDSRADAALADTVEMFPAAAEIVDRHPAFRLAFELEGNYRSMSTHAAGLIITSQPISDICALYTRENAKGETLTAVSVNKYDAEHIGLMKVDLLGLSTMGMIGIALAEAGMTLEELYRIPMDEPDTLAAFRRNDVIGIFQFEGRATRMVNGQMIPDDFLELVDVSGLARPGPLFSRTTWEYIEVKHGRQPRPSVHPILDEITAGTKGQIIYQEQILKALRLFGGLSVARVHEIRRIISQKLGEAQFNTSAEDFVVNAMKTHSVSREVATEVWKRVVTSASYAFVYAHSLSYTMIGFWSMYLKVHYPTAFYSAMLQKLPEERWPRLIRDAEAHGIEIRSVVPGLSGKTWRSDGRSVIAGWLQLKGVGPGKADNIVDYERENGPGAIQTAEDLLKVSGIGEKTLEKFRSQIESDDPFGLLRTSIMLNAVRASIANGEVPLPKPTHVSNDILDAPRSGRIIWLGICKLVEYKDFIEDERARSGKSVADIRKEMTSPSLTTACVLHCYDDADEDVYVRITRFKFPKFRETIERIRPGEDVLYVMAKKSPFTGVFPSLFLERLWLVDPDDDGDE